MSGTNGSNLNVVHLDFLGCSSRRLTAIFLCYIGEELEGEGRSEGNQDKRALIFLIDGVNLPRGTFQNGPSPLEFENTNEVDRNPC